MTAAGALSSLGFGNMAEAILKGVRETNLFSAEAIHVYDIAEARRSAARALGFQVHATPDGLAAMPGALLIAVKPQQFAEAAGAIQSALTDDTLVISIMAGVGIAAVGERLGTARVARVMPNLPAQAAAGAAGIAMAEGCTEDDVNLVRKIFEAVGTAEVVDEAAIDTITAISGSGPAYFFRMAELMAETAASFGLPEAMASRLAAQTLIGAGALVRETGEGPAVLRARVTSKGGTTAAALDAFEQAGLGPCIRAGMEACRQRARELGA